MKNGMKFNIKKHCGNNISLKRSLFYTMIMSADSRRKYGWTVKNNPEFFRCSRDCVR